MSPSRGATPPLTSNEADYLDHAKDMQRKGFSGVFSGRLFRRTVFDRLTERGLFRPVRLYVSDGDGFAVEPERERWGWEITPDGAQALATFVLWPPRGPCAFCGGPDARHRSWDAIASRHAAGETVGDLAADFGLTEAHIEAAIARGESALDVTSKTEARALARRWLCGNRGDADEARLFAWVRATVESDGPATVWRRLGVKKSKAIVLIELAEQVTP